MEKLISVVMSTYNEPIEYIEKSINSIEIQTWKNIEFIIIIDNPENKELVKEIQKICGNYNNIILIVNEINRGLPYSLNRAIEYATGEYIARMDADDISFPKRLEEEVNFLEKNSYDMVSSSKININKSGEIIDGRIMKLPSNEDVNRILPYFCFIIHPSVVVKAEVLKKLKYREFKAAQDYDLWLRMLSDDYKIGVIDKPLIYYRVRNDNITNKNSMKQTYFVEYIRKLYKERKKNDNKDSYAENSPESFLKEHGYYDEAKKIKYEKAQCRFISGTNYIHQNKFLLGIVELLFSMKVKYIRKRILGVIFYNIMIKIGIVKRKFNKVKRDKQKKCV